MKGILVFGGIDGAQACPDRSPACDSRASIAVERQHPSPPPPPPLLDASKTENLAAKQACPELVDF